MESALPLPASRLWPLTQGSAFQLLFLERRVTVPIPEALASASAAVYPGVGESFSGLFPCAAFSGFLIVSGCLRYTLGGVPNSFLKALEK